jgi:hypothetical protein
VRMTKRKGAEMDKKKQGVIGIAGLQGLMRHIGHSTVISVATSTLTSEILESNQCGMPGLRHLAASALVDSFNTE